MSRILRVSVNRESQSQEQESQGPYDTPGQEYDSWIDNDPTSVDYEPGALGFDDYDYQESQKARERAHAVVLGASVVLLAAIFSVIVFLLSVRNDRQATVGSSSNSGSVSVAGLATGPRTGMLAPDFSLVDVHTNQAIKLSSLRGKPVFINFWGTWCPPCRAEMPEMQRLYSKYPGQLDILGISMAPRDDPEQVKNFVDQYKYPWTFIHDPEYTVATTYQISAVPSSFFIDKDGVIKAVQIGGMNLDIMDRNFQLIR